MYTLYILPGACSLAVHVVLRELGQDVMLIHRDAASHYRSLNPTGQVPTLVSDGLVLREGAAIILYLLDKHANTLLPKDRVLRRKALENLMFANASMHPAYGRLFFLNRHRFEDASRQAFQEACAREINGYWQVVEHLLASQPFLGGEQHGVADIMLTVYARWGGHFDVGIRLGERVQQMVDRVIALPSFQQALQAEARIQQR